MQPCHLCRVRVTPLNLGRFPRSAPKTRKTRQLYQNRNTGHHNNIQHSAPKVEPAQQHSTRFISFKTYDSTQPRWKLTCHLKTKHPVRVIHSIRVQRGRFQSNAKPALRQQHSTTQRGTHMARTRRLEVYADTQGGYRWRLTAPNGNIIGDSGESLPPPTHSHSKPPEASMTSPNQSPCPTTSFDAEKSSEPKKKN